MGDARQAFRDVADEASPAIARFWVEAVEGANREFVHELVCKCGFRDRQPFTVPDIVARSKAAEMLLQYGWGRPGTAEPERDMSGLLDRPAEELSGGERAVLIALLRERLSTEETPDADIE